MNAEHRAEREIRRSNARARGPGGRPLIGKERRVAVHFRLEPSMLAELKAMTGCTPRQLVERIHATLKVVSEYKQAKAAALANVESLLVEPLDKTA